MRVDCPAASRDFDAVPLDCGEDGGPHAHVRQTNLSGRVHRHRRVMRRDREVVDAHVELQVHGAIRARGSDLACRRVREGEPPAAAALLRTFGYT